MDFDNVRLPEDVEQGAKGGPTFKTVVLTADGGQEWSNQKWQFPRAEWDIGYGIMEQVDYLAVVQFFLERRGKQRKFRFKDWTDYTADNEFVATGDGATKTFQLIKTYGTVAPLVRNILLPVQDTVEVTVGGVVAHPTIDYTTGLITFTTLTAPPMGAAIRASFEFDLLVRFDIDKLALDVTWVDAAEAPDISIIECRL